MDILVVVDMQNDFVSGSLGSTHAQAIVGNVVSAIDSWNGKVIFTRDSHNDNYLSTQEGKNLPVSHCIVGTWGHEIIDELKSYTNDNLVINKPTFGSTELAETLANDNSIDSITLVGLCTDICVISNALLLKASMPETKISVISSCCAGVTEESHNNALQAMRMCQIDVH